MKHKVLLGPNKSNEIVFDHDFKDNKCDITFHEYVQSSFSRSIKIEDVDKETLSSLMGVLLKISQKMEEIQSRTNNY